MNRRVRPVTLQSPCSFSVVLAAVASVPDRGALAAIVFVLKSGIPWEMIPLRDGMCQLSGSTCSGDAARDLQTGSKQASGTPCAGCWSTGSERPVEIDWSRASLDSANDAGQKG